MKVRMKFHAGVLIVLAILFAFTLLAHARELANPSFEEPGGEGQLWISDRALQWERWGGWFNRETSWTPVADGQCIMAYHHWKIQGDETAGIYQDIPNLPADKHYAFNIEATRDKFTNMEYVELRLEPFLGGNTLASQTYRMNDLKSGKWTTLTVDGRSPTIGIRVLVIVKPGRRSTRKGSVKFDSASFKSVDATQNASVKFPFNNRNRYATPRRRR